MIFKLLGAGLIISASSKIGFDFAASLSKRVEQLQDLKLGLSAFLTEISFRSLPLADALLKSAQSMHTDAKNIFLNASKILALKNGVTAKEAFSEVIENTYDLSLKTEDFLVIRSFSALLGNSDIDNQIANIKLTQNKLDNLIQQAQLSQEKYSKLYRSSGVLAGLLITILFI